MTFVRSLITEWRFLRVIRCWETHTWSWSCKRARIALFIFPFCFTLCFAVSATKFDDSTAKLGSGIAVVTTDQRWEQWTLLLPNKMCKDSTLTTFKVYYIALNLFYFILTRVCTTLDIEWTWMDELDRRGREHHGNRHGPPNINSPKLFLNSISTYINFLRVILAQGPR